MNGFGNGNKSNNRRKIKDAKQSIENIVNKAIQLHFKGNITEAIKYYQYCLNLGVNDCRIFTNYASILKDMGRLKESEMLTRKAIKINPKFLNAYYNLGSILIDLGNYKEAEIYTRKGIELNPNDSNFYQKLSIILTELGKPKEAESSLLKAIKIDPNDPILYQSLAIILIELDKQRDAKISLYKSIKINPNITKNYYLLSTLTLLGKDKEITDKIFSKGILENQKEKDLIDIYFTRANILEQQCKYSQASEYLKKANNLNLKIYGSDYLDFQNKMKNCYINSTKTTNIRNESSNLPTPIFIVGLPRSGKSITESILACNDRTIKCGEEKALDSAVNIYLEMKEELNEKSLFKMYLDNLNKDIRKDSFIISTTPFNFIYTGLIVRKIPNAKIIFCHRNPLDNILKLYQKNLSSKHTYSNSITESANIWLESYLLMERYKKEHKSKIYFLKYEDLIKYQTNQIKNLINWLGWEYSDKYLRPRIDISTSSASNILNIDEISIWKNYHELLTPAIEILENNSNLIL